MCCNIGKGGGKIMKDLEKLGKIGRIIDGGNKVGNLSRTDAQLKVNDFLPLIYAKGSSEIYKNSGWF